MWQVPNVEFVIGCGDAPCGHLPPAQKPVAANSRKTAPLRRPLTHSRLLNKAGTAGAAGALLPAQLPDQSPAQQTADVDDFGSLVSVVEDLRHGGSDADQEVDSRPGAPKP